MDDVDKFGYELAFNSIVYSITNRRTDFSETALIYLDDAKSFFRDIVKSLESIIEAKEYFIVENLCPILKMAGYKCSNPSKKDIGKMGGGFRNLIKQLDKLKQNPNEFYNDGNSQKLLNLCEKIRDFYTPNYSSII